MQPATGSNLSEVNFEEPILNEVTPTFRVSSVPQLAKDEVQLAVRLLIKLLAHRVGDPDLDAVGGEIQEGLRRWFDDHELVKLADRYEPFCKFVLRLVDPTKFAELKRREQSSDPKERPGAAYVLKAHGLDIVSNKELELFAKASWESFPSATLQGQLNFLEHIARIYVFRNVDDHRARVLNQREKAQIAESFCVFLVWVVFKFRQEIQTALMAAEYTCYLGRVRDRFASIGTRYIELLTERRFAEEYRFLDPLAPLPENESVGDVSAASNLADANRVVVIEADPGAGKTTTLKFLAWRCAESLLTGGKGKSRVPVYLELKLLKHRHQTIEEAIQKELSSTEDTVSSIPWASLLLLVDGLNEVDSHWQTNFQTELNDLLSKFLNLSVVVAGRLNAFRGELSAQVVVLRKLSDQQLTELFRRGLGDDAKAAAALERVRQNIFLESWVRTPLHAALIAGVVERQGVSALSNHALVVRACVRGLLNREVIQAPGQTLLLRKELLLSRLAYETKQLEQLAFHRTDALRILSFVQDVPEFIHEVTDNNILQQVDGDTVAFSHELYQDYFAAAELETRERSKPGLGDEVALLRFADPNWQECIRLYAGLTGTHAALIQREVEDKAGAERNPFLSWRLLRDANLDLPELVEKVADEAYCALSAQLTTPTKAALAGACVLVLADLERNDLLKQAVIEQRQTFEPTGLWKLSDEDRELAAEKQKQTVVPLANGLLLLVRLGLQEQRAGKEGRFCQASRAVFQALNEIKAARALTAMLLSWKGKTFDSSKLIPGVVLDTLIDLGVDEVLNQQSENLSRTLAEWLARASEGGFPKAWPAYGRLLRLARRSYVAECGIEFDPEAALKWLRKAHETGDSLGSLELALLFIEEPDLQTEAGEGERLLRTLATGGMLEAQFELGNRLLNGDGLPKAEGDGFRFLIEAAEAGHLEALWGELNIGIQWWLLSDIKSRRPEQFLAVLPLAPDWAAEFKDRWMALFQKRQPR